MKQRKFSFKSDKMQSMSRLLDFGLFVCRRFSEAQVIQVAGSLTFNLLLDLVPLLTVILVMVSAFPMFGDLSTHVMALVNDLIVPSGASAVAEYLAQFKQQAAKLTTMGILMMVITSLMQIQTIESTFNRIWNVRRSRPLAVKLPVYWALLTLAPLLVGLSVSLSAYLFKSEQLYELTFFSGSLKTVGQIMLDVTGLWLLYRFVPYCHVASKHALVGALITACLLEGMKTAFGFYVQNFNSYQLVYGAFAAIPVFLIWLHLLWLIILTGAVITASLPYWNKLQRCQEVGRQARFDEIVTILMILHRAQRKGQGIKTRIFRQQTDIGYGELEHLLMQLEKYRYIAQSKCGWLLQTAAEQIRLDKLFTQFIYAAPPEGSSAAALLLQQMLAANTQALSLSLSEFEQRLAHTAKTDIVHDDAQTK